MSLKNSTDKMMSLKNSTDKMMSLKNSMNKMVALKNSTDKMMSLKNSTDKMIAFSNLISKIEKGIEKEKKMENRKNSKINQHSKKYTNKLIKLIFCLASISSDAFEKRFCLVLGTTLCNLFIIQNKLLHLKKGGMNSPKSQKYRESKELAAVALASAHSQLQICGGSSGRELRDMEAEEIENRIAKLELLTRLENAESSYRRAQLASSEIEEEEKVNKLAKEIVVDMLSSNVGRGTYLNICAQSTTSSIACFSLIRITEQICINIGETLSSSVVNAVESVTPEIVSKTVSDINILARNTGSWFSSTYDYLTGVVPQNITQGINITPEDIAQAEIVQNQINHMILSNSIMMTQFASRTDVQLSCAVGALTCCCLLTRESNRVLNDRRTAALTYANIFENAHKMDQLRSNGLATIANAAAAGFSSGTMMGIPSASRIVNMMTSTSQPQLIAPAPQQMDRSPPPAPPTPPSPPRQRSTIRRRMGSNITKKNPK